MAARPTISLPVVTARVLTIVCAVAASAWAVSVLPIFWSERKLDQVANQITAGHSFRPDILVAATTDLDGGASRRPSALGKAAIVQLRMVEQLIAMGDRQQIDAELDALRHRVEDAFANTPADPFLFLILFWAENTRNGLAPEHFRYLRMSYELGPNEGWIAMKRNRLSLALFPALPPELADRAISEFARLVASGFSGEAANLLAGPGWPIRYRLLESLKNVHASDRLTFAKALRAKGLEDLPVLGIAPGSLR